LRAKILRPFSAALLCCLCLANCSSVDSLGVATPDEERALISEAASTSPNLQPGEKIKVTVFGEDRLSGEYEIDPGGYVSLPLAGTVKAAGLSKQEFELALTKKFQGEYLRDPKVTVEVSSFRPFYILGEVTKPGEYPYKGGLSVLSAIALAGGSTYRASLSSVMIQHAGEAVQGVSDVADDPRAARRPHSRARALFLIRRDRLVRRLGAAGADGAGRSRARSRLGPVFSRR
jgi:polysaccharide export outer membrane protein